METPRLTSETSSDVAGKKETTKKKKKAGTALGALIVEPKSQKLGDKVGGESFWRRSSKDETPSTLELDQKASKETDAPSVHENADAKESVDSPEIDAAEKLYTERELVQFKIEQASEDSDPIEEVTRFRRRIVEQGQDSDVALAETLAEIEDQDSDANISKTSAEDELLAVSEYDNNLNVPQEFGDEEINLSETGADYDESVTSSASSTPPPIGATSNGGRGNNRPPLPPTTSGAAQPPNGPLSPRGNSAYTSLFPHQANYNPNIGPVSQSSHIEYIDDGNPAAAALVGGIIGYLIGHRRGRKKTEKKLVPIQKKLEKEVGDLQWQLQAKEFKIRDAVRQKQSTEQVVDVPSSVQLRPTQQSSAKKTPERPGRLAAPEATQLHGKKRAPEQIGHMLVAAEAHEASKYDAPKVAEKLRPRDVLSPKNIKTLNRVELLAVSERIIIEGTSLRQIYETHLVGERGLRRLVAEYVRGGNLKKVLREEIVEREIDFERDPAMHDSLSTSTYLEPAGTAAPALQNLLQKVEANNNTEKEEVAFLKARADYETKTQVQQQKHRHLIDATLGTTILILVILVAVLVLTR